MAPPAATTDLPTTDPRSLYSQRGKAAPSMPRLATSEVENRISFVYGFPDPDSLPAAQVAAAATKALDERGRWALQYGDTTGYAGLIDVLREKLRRDQGIDIAADQVLITAGGSQAMGLVLDTFVDWGDTIISEMPTWLGAVQAFRNVGANVVSVPVDEDGTDVEAVARALDRLQSESIRPKFIYVISNFQNPTGITTTLARRRRLIELARAHDTLILEDDAYFDLRYDGVALPSIFALDGGRSTMYLGTFSKTMGPGMRLGWLLAPAPIIATLATLKVDGGTNVFGAHVAAEWLPEHLTDHVGHLRGVYQRRRDLMLAALAQHMPEGTTWTEPDGGFFIWVTLPEAIDTVRMLPQVRERGVDYLPGPACFSDGSGRNQLRLSFSFAADDTIEPGIKTIGEIAAGELLEARNS
jgi:2-aminoadipate transaminase